MKKGFTLIELLVVVLIIGILAAVALPQYQKAVYKSYYAQMQTILRSAVIGYETYYLANGTFPESFDELDISFPALGTECTTHVGNDDVIDCLSFKDYQLELMKPGRYPGLGIFLDAKHNRRLTSGYQWTFNALLNGRHWFCRRWRTQFNEIPEDNHCTGSVLEPNWDGAWYTMD